MNIVTIGKRHENIGPGAKDVKVKSLYTENHLNFCEIQNTILQQEKIKAHTFESDVLRKTNEKNEINALEITLKEVIDESKREHVDEETKCYDELVKKEACPPT